MEFDRRHTKHLLRLIGVNLIAAVAGLVIAYFVDVLLGLAVFVVLLFLLPVIVQYRFLEKEDEDSGD